MVSGRIDRQIPFKIGMNIGSPSINILGALVCRKLFCLQING